MANRKLQGEIERVLKKVDEGVQVFEQIWDKVYGATTTAQKEKYEGDLKKEIKKLQRLRDQIKTWQGDSSIKDKSKLDSNRKLIEEKMEKFKICEKETKTKAFSKEGLAQDRTDPKQKAKENVEKWVGEAIARLNEQSDEMEAEIEATNSGKRKKRGEENPRVTQLKDHISRHQYHVTMLERVFRAVLNETVSTEEASELKETIDYYIDCNQDPDFFEDDEMYDTLNLNAVPTPAAGKKGTKTREREKEQEEEDLDSASSITAAVTKKAPASPRSARTTKVSSTSSTPTQRTPSSSANSARAASPKSTRNDRSPTVITPQSPRNGASAMVSRDVSNTRGTMAPLLSSVVKGATAKTNQKTTQPSNVLSTDLNGRQQPVQTQTIEPMSHGRLVPSAISGRLAREADLPTTSGVNEGKGIEAMGSIPSDVDVIRSILEGAKATKSTQKFSGMDPSLAAIEAALAYMPEAATPSQKLASPSTSQRQPPGDTALTGASAPRNPIKVPSSFPVVPAPVFDSREVFEQFDPDTLFFIFYYQQGTYQQYLAATELKRQGWRFHKKYLTWFQRHDEPKMSTDEYETGTFIYFDYANVVVQGHGTGWCQRIKSEFVFEYRFLEDELV